MWDSETRRGARDAREARAFAAGTHRSAGGRVAGAVAWRVRAVHARRQGGRCLRRIDEARQPPQRHVAAPSGMRGVLAVVHTSASVVASAGQPRQTCCKRFLGVVRCANSTHRCWARVEWLYRTRAAAVSSDGQRPPRLAATLIHVTQTGCARRGPFAERAVWRSLRWVARVRPGGQASRRTKTERVWAARAKGSGAARRTSVRRAGWAA